MTVLGLGQVAKPAEVTVSFRAGWVKYLRVALSSAGGAAIAFSLFALLEHQPADGFGLLLAWGPWPIVVLVAVAMCGRFLSRMNDTVQTAFGAVVAGVQQGADAQTKTADALSRLADQGSRHAQEIERLTIYAAQEVTGLQDRMDRHHEMLRQMQASLNTLLGREGHGRRD